MRWFELGACVVGVGCEHRHPNWDPNQQGRKACNRPNTRTYAQSGEVVQPNPKLACDYLLADPKQACERNSGGQNRSNEEREKNKKSDQRHARAV